MTWENTTTTKKMIQCLRRI